jgi:phosphoribosylanthranilate isomerase
MAKIKICGLMRVQDIAAVNDALPDYIGFVFARSKRRIDPWKARELRACLDPFIKAVGVFVNEYIKNIVKLCDSDVIDLIQLHGDENEEYINELKGHVSKKIIKAVRVRDTEDIIRAADRPVITCFSMHSRREVRRYWQAFDWSVIPDLKKPYFLAGASIRTISSGNRAL